jgi:hypothetical protein
MGDGCPVGRDDEPTEGHTSRRLTNAHRQMDIDECIDLAVREAVEADQDERHGDDYPF